MGQLMEIIKVLGTPSRDDLSSMNPNYLEFKFPQIKSHPWSKVFRSRTTPEATDWIGTMLQYNPNARPSGLESCMHAFFDELREQDAKICGSKPLPEHLFWFSKDEVALMDQNMRCKLIPEWVTFEQGCDWPARGRGIKLKGAGVKQPSTTFDEAARKSVA